MDTQTKNKILVIAVIFLIVLNLATIGSIFYHISRMRKLAAQEQPIAQVNNRVVRPDYGRGPQSRASVRRERRERVSPHFRRIMDSLHLTPEQRKYFLEKRRQFMRTHRPLMDSLLIYHESLDSLACSVNPDTTKIRFYSQRIASLHYRFTHDFALLVNQWYQQCNPEQRTKFCQIFRHKKSYYSDYRRHRKTRRRR